MPVDTNIPLQAQRFRTADPMAQFGQLLQLKQAQSANALNDFQMQKAMREDARLTGYRNALKGAVGPEGVDYNALKAAAVEAGDIDTAMNVDKSLQATNAFKQEQRLKALEEAEKRIDITSRLLAGVQDDATHQAFRQRMGQMFGAEALAGIPETFDPAWKESELAGAMTYKDHVAAGLAELKFGEDKRHNLESELTARVRAANSGPMALVTAPDGTMTAVGGPNGMGPNAMQSLANARGAVKAGEKQGEAVGKYFGEQYADILKASDASYLEDSKLNRLDSLLADVETGKFKGATTEIKKAAKAAGIDLESVGVLDDVAPVEAARALAGEMALQLRNPAGGAGMPGAMSDADRNFLQSMVPGIETTAEGRKLIIQSRKQINQRARDVAKMAIAYRKANGGLDEGFSEQLQQYSEQNPMFRVVSAENADKDYAAIKSGEYFMGPDGHVRMKP